MRDRWERHQLAVYLGGLGIGVAVGVLTPTLGRPLEHVVTPLLAVLLYATFLQVPLERPVAALGQGRFLPTLLAVNFVAAPLVVAALLGLARLDGTGPADAVVVGLLLTLLTPCIDYVVVFTGVAGGDRERLLACTPILLGLQALLLPGYLWLLGPGPDPGSLVSPGPFVTALVALLLLPLGAALLTRRAGPRSAARRLRAGADAAMVPLLALVLLAVAASQVPRLDGRLDEVAAAVPLLVGFTAAMLVVGLLAARLTGLAVPEARALVLSGITRNSLVVLPLALTLPPELDLAPAVVVTQTLVELLVLLGLVRALPRWVA